VSRREPTRSQGFGVEPLIDVGLGSDRSVSAGHGTAARGGCAAVAAKVCAAGPWLPVRGGHGGQWASVAVRCPRDIRCSLLGLHRLAKSLVAVGMLWLGVIQTIPSST